MRDVPDLAALREKADRLAAIDACEWSFGDNETELMVDMTPQFRDECVEAMLAVLSLVDDLRAENERLREAVKWARQEFRNLQADGYPEVLDLGALRKKAEKIRQACPCCNPFGDEDGNDAAAQQILAVLSLVDDLRAENERLREYVAAAEAVFAGDTWDMPAAMDRVDRAREALAGSPAANEEQQ